MTRVVASRLPVDEFTVEVPSPGQVMWRRARSHIGLLSGTGFVVLVTLLAIFAPLVSPSDPYTQNLELRLLGPVWGEAGTWLHPLGTDSLGRDYLTRILHGARISLMVGFGAALISGLVGSTIGIIGGYFGGRTDAVMMYLINVKLALPGILIALSMVSVFGGSLVSLIAILGFLFWDRFAVVTRTVTQQIRSREFVAAAEAVGASHARIILREVLPNVFSHIIVVASLEMAIAILVEAVLSFLGLGIQPPTPSWGLLISEGRSFMFFKPYLITLPGLALFLLVIAINLMGDGIRDITVPEERGR